MLKLSFFLKHSACMKHANSLIISVLRAYVLILLQDFLIFISVLLSPLQAFSRFSILCPTGKDSFSVFRNHRILLFFLNLPISRSFLKYTADTRNGEKESA